MTHTSTEQPSLTAIIRDLRESHARTSPGAWGKGATTHETVSRAEGLEPYKVAEFRHANDAQFCDLAHVFVPRLLSEIEALQSRVNELEAQLSATHPTQHGLEQFIEQTGDVHFQRCRVGSKEGEIRWDVEFGHYGAEVRGKTLRDAITKALAAQTKKEGEK